MPRDQHKVIDEYIKKFPLPAQKAMRQLKAAIKKAAPKAQETISYGIPTFDQNGHHLVHFGAFKSHIGFFPTASGVAEFKSGLGDYKISKGTIQFPLSKPMPLPLVTRIVKFRVKENEKRKA